MPFDPTRPINDTVVGATDYMLGRRESVTENPKAREKSRK